MQLGSKCAVSGFLPPFLTVDASVDTCHSPLAAFGCCNCWLETPTKQQLAQVSARHSFMSCYRTSTWNIDPLLTNGPISKSFIAPRSLSLINWSALMTLLIGFQQLTPFCEFKWLNVVSSNCNKLLYQRDFDTGENRPKIKFLTFFFLDKLELLKFVYNPVNDRRRKNGQQSATISEEHARRSMLLTFKFE